MWKKERQETVFSDSITKVPFLDAIQKGDYRRITLVGNLTLRRVVKQATVQTYITKSKAQMILRAISDVREAHLSKLIIDSLKYDSKMKKKS